MFTATLFIVARAWKQPKPIDRRMDKEDVVCTCNGILLSHKNKIMPSAATLMQLKIIMLTEIIQKEKDKLYDIT